jgi:hypothetical protein
MTTNNQPVTPGISSALDVPVTHGSKEGESAVLVHLVCLVDLGFLVE